MGKIIKPLLIMDVLLITIGLGWLLGIPEQAAPDNENRMIDLPQPRYQSDISVEESLLRRRSVRQYQEKEITLDEVSQLLWAAQGITRKEIGFRTAPSAGATYPIETYAVVGSVKGLKAGIYHYQPQGHTLVLKLKGDQRSELRQAALNQGMITEAPINLIFAANYSRTTRRYGEERGKRYVYMEAGHIGQNVHLQAEALGLGTVVIGAFKDDEVKNILMINEEPLYIMPVGWKLE